MVGRRIAADEHEEIAALDILELHRRRSRSKARCQTDAARLVAVVRAVVDVVGPEHPRQELQQESRFVRRAAAGVKERAPGRGGLQRSDDAAERLVPCDDAVVRLSRAGVDRIDEPAARFQLTRRKGSELGNGVTRKELRRNAVLHVGGHRLQRLLADFGKMPRFVDHPALLAAHAERARLARVPASHRAPQRHPAHAIRRLERVADCLPATCRCHVRDVITTSRAEGERSRRSARCGRARTKSRLPASLEVSAWSSPV